MALEDIYRTVTAGRMGAAERAAAMIKFQAGLDASTLADRFKYEGYA